MNKLSTQPDTCLLDYLKDDSFAAFEEIYNRYWRLLYSICYKRTQSSEVSEEIVQDIFTSVWEKRKVIKVENLSAYLYMAAKYKIINHFHREMSKRNYLASQPDFRKEVENCTEETVLLQDLDHAFQHEIEKLPSRRKIIFKLYKQQNLSMKQVASQLGISEKTVENQLNKAFKMLRVSLRHFLSLASLLIAHITAY